MKKLIAVADWAADSLTCQEIKTTIEGYLDNPNNPNISFVSSTPSTIHTAYLISQLVEIEERYGRPLNTVIFQGSDSVVDNPEGLSKIWGRLVIIRLKSGLHIIGPNSGYVYSLIRSKIETVFQYPGLPDSGSFRARDNFARIVVLLMESQQDNLDLEAIYTHIIPGLQDYYVGHIDSFGNIITTAPESVVQQKYTYGDIVTVTINGETKQAQYAKSLFDAQANTLIIYPGTTGTTDDPFLEISIYSDKLDDTAETGIYQFEDVIPGAKIDIQ
ncbi:MAG TPA: SAM-dependent chlorinase/fluorinase [Candidatus Woesebacteria bacterium]|mgnify:CR=1 FL=1|nr:SAM-dependent chlorinase/fluorinase [Candidatus Woesebacteria bacterium]